MSWGWRCFECGEPFCGCPWPVRRAFSARPSDLFDLGSGVAFDKIILHAPIEKDREERHNIVGKGAFVLFKSQIADLGNGGRLEAGKRRVFLFTIQHPEHDFLIVFAGARGEASKIRALAIGFNQTAYRSFDWLVLFEFGVFKRNLVIKLGCSRFC